MEKNTAKPYEGNQPYIFVSYSHKDRRQVLPIIERLADDGYRVWYDEGIHPGSEWPEIVAGYLDRSAVCIAVISANSVKSDNCRREINFTLQKGKPIISVFLDKTALSPGMQMQLSTSQALFKHSLSEESFYTKLYSSPFLPDTRDETENADANSRPSSRKKQWVIAAAVLTLIAAIAVTAIVMFGKNRIQSDLQETTAPSSEATTAPPPKVPSCINMQLSDAENALKKLGLVVSTEFEFSDTVAEGCVTAQSLAADEIARNGDKITLTVSKGVQPEEPDYLQKLTVTSAKGESNAVAVLYEWRDSEWVKLANYKATVGKKGIGSAYEGNETTPQGVFPLGYVLTANDPDTQMSVKTVTSSTCVVDDVNSVYYNQVMDSNSLPSDVNSYDLIGQSLTDGTTYATIFIEHNGNGFSFANVEREKCSAIGLRGQNGELSATLGDVDISAEDMKDLLKKLDPDKSPMIETKTE